MASPLGHYVYLHIRNDDGRVFYVGKGTKRRAWTTSKRNPHHSSVIQKMKSSGHGWSVLIVEENMPPEQAFALEKKIIKIYGRDSLVNLSDGGECGSAGHKRSANAIEKSARANRGRKMSRDAVEKSAAAKRGKPRSAETKEKLSKALLGKKHSAERCLAKSVRQTGKPVAASTIAAMTKATSIPVICNETRILFQSASEAARQMGLLRECVRDVVAGRQKTTGGYSFSKVEKKVMEGKV